MDGDHIPSMGLYFLHSNQYSVWFYGFPQFQRSQQTEHRSQHGVLIGASGQPGDRYRNPLVAYVTVDGNPVLSGSRMTIIAGIFLYCAVICYLLCFKLVSERVPVPANNQKLDLAALGKNLITNRALVGIIVAALLLLLAMLGMQGMAGYVFPTITEVREHSLVVSLLSNVAMLAICAPLAGKLAARFGKKELATVSCLFWCSQLSFV